MKRFTHLPQFFLGAAFAWAVPMAFASVQNALPAVCWILYVAALVWPIAYDTEYAMADREDDLKVGVKSTAILFGRYDRFWVGFFHFVFLLLMFWVGVKEALGWACYVGLFAAALLCFCQQVKIVSRQPTACFQAFLNNQWVGFVIFLGVLVSFS